MTDPTSSEEAEGIRRVQAPIPAPSSPRPRPGRPGPSGEPLRWWTLGVVVAALVPRLLTAGQFATTDEPTWLNRTVRFSDALAGLDLANATASVGEPATMPGGTTMWIGTFARGLWRLGVEVGLVDGGRFVSLEGLAVAQLLMALVTALLVGALFVVVARWVGLVAGLTAAILVGLGPWFVALGTVLHTDELTALFGTIGVVALAWVLDVPGGAPAPTRPRLVAALAGASLMCSALTKVTGAGFWVGAAVVAVWAVARARRSGEGWWVPGGPLRLVGLAALTGVAIVPLFWPAILVDPVFQLERLWAAAGLSVEEPVLNRGIRQYYLGEALDSPGWTYYPVALALRVTPWFLVLALVGLPAALAWRSTRRQALILLAPMAAFAVVLTASPKKFDRYGLVLLVPLAVIVGMAVQRALRDRLPALRARQVVVGAGALALLVSVWVAPWGLAWFNPAVGGSSAGHDNLLVGWGEGSELAAQRIEELEGGCDDVTVLGLPMLLLLSADCSTPPLDGVSEPDYVVLYVSTLQRNPSVREAVDGRELVDVIEIRGIPYAEIWR